MVTAARDAGVVLMEGFHYRHHPVMKRVVQLVRSGALGGLRSIETGFLVPTAITPPGHSRLRYEHGGGSAIDPGCYCINLLRLLTGEEPSEVTASARTGPPEVDLAMQAHLRFPGGCTGRFETCLDADLPSVRAWLRVEGERGSIELNNPYVPHDTTVSIRGEGLPRTISPDLTWTFVHQLRAAVRAMLAREGAAFAGDAVRNAVLIDRVYGAAGLRPRAQLSRYATGNDALP